MNRKEGESVRLRNEYFGGVGNPFPCIGEFLGGSECGRGVLLENQSVLSSQVGVTEVAAP